LSVCSLAARLMTTIYLSLIPTNSSGDRNPLQRFSPDSGGDAENSDDSTSTNNPTISSHHKSSDKPPGAHARAQRIESSSSDNPRNRRPKSPRPGPQPIVMGSSDTDEPQLGPGVELPDTFQVDWASDAIYVVAVDGGKKSRGYGLLSVPSTNGQLQIKKAVPAYSYSRQRNKVSSGLENLRESLTTSEVASKCQQPAIPMDNNNTETNDTSDNRAEDKTTQPSPAAFVINYPVIPNVQPKDLAEVLRDSGQPLYWQGGDLIQQTKQPARRGIVTTPFFYMESKVLHGSDASRLRPVSLRKASRKSPERSDRFGAELYKLGAAPFRTGSQKFLAIADTLCSVAQWHPPISLLQQVEG
jgi:hypothetical protein